MHTYESNFWYKKFPIEIRSSDFESDIPAIVGGRASYPLLCMRSFRGIVYVGGEVGRDGKLLVLRD